MTLQDWKRRHWVVTQFRYHADHGEFPWLATFEDVRNRPKQGRHTGQGTTEEAACYALARQAGITWELTPSPVDKSEPGR